MSSVVIIQIEGLLTETDEELPAPSPSMLGLRLVKALASAWPVVYATTAPRDIAAEWIRTAGAPAPVWIASAPQERLTAEVLSALGARQDRAQMYVSTTRVGFDKLIQAKVATMLYHAEEYPLGDWKQPSSWDGDGGRAEHGDVDMVHGR